MYPITLSKDSVTVCVDGKSHMIMQEHSNYKAVIDAIRAKNWKDLPNLLNPAAAAAFASKGNFRIEDGVVYVKCEDKDLFSMSRTEDPEFFGETESVEFKCPTDLGAQILLFMEHGLDTMPLVRFARKLRENPSYHAVQQLFGWIQTAHLTITTDGNFIAYKGVSHDMLDLHSRTFNNSVGAIVSMPRNEVDENPNHSCKPGLHVANYNYAHNNYGGGDNVTIVVEVHPKDVVAVPIGEHYKMRVCSYRVLEVSEGSLTEYVYDKSCDNPEPDLSDADLPEEDDLLDDENADISKCRALKSYPV